jgi:hypothetical protein
MNFYMNVCMHVYERVHEHVYEHVYEPVYGSVSSRSKGSPCSCQHASASLSLCCLRPCHELCLHLLIPLFLVSRFQLSVTPNCTHPFHRWTPQLLAIMESCACTCTLVGTRAVLAAACLSLVSHIQLSVTPNCTQPLRRWTPQLLASMRSCACILCPTSS